MATDCHQLAAIRRISVRLAHFLLTGILLLVCSSTANAAAAPVARAFWPHGAEGAVSLTFDDGMPSQLERALPLLDRAGFKATFYVNPGYSLDWEKNRARWREVALSGHELGNHTDRHPCSCQNDFRKGESYCLEKLEMGEVVRAIDAAERALQELTGQPPAARSFAYPCYDSDLGAGVDRRSYVPEVARRYAAGRVGGAQDNDPQTVDLAYLHAFAVDGEQSPQVIASIEGALARGHWAVIVFHGIGAEWNVFDATEFEKVIAYLSNNRGRIWVAPVIEVANYIRDHRPVHAAQRD